MPGPTRRSLYIPCELKEEIRASRIQPHHPVASEPSAPGVGIPGSLPAPAAAATASHPSRSSQSSSCDWTRRHHERKASHQLHQRKMSQSQDFPLHCLSQGGPPSSLSHSNSTASSIRSLASADSQTHLITASSSSSTLCLVDEYASMTQVDLKRSVSNTSVDSLDYDRGFRQTCIYEYDRSPLPPLPPPSPTVVVTSTTTGLLNEKAVASPVSPNAATPLKPAITRWVIFRTWFSPYRQILLGVVMLNALGLILASTHVWEYPYKDPTALVTANILIAVSIRSEWVLRFIFWVTVKLFQRWPPLKMRAWIVGLLYHIGGLHSGCGVSAFMWLSWATYRNFYRHSHFNAPILFVMGVIFLCVAVTCITALPFIRGPHHNIFEMTHRFAGWTGVVFTWIFVVLGSCWNSKRLVWDWSVGHLTQRPEFWCTYLFTILIGAAWVSVERVSVVCTAPSRKVTVVRFPEGLTSGVHARVSVGGLKEWHVFGTISEGRQASCHYVVMAVQGNFTTAINRQLPEKLYTRRWKLCGLPYFSRLFTKGVAICTGSGIGAVGSTCLQHDSWFLVWIGGDLEDTYGEELCTLMRKGTQGRSLIWDTKKRGRPDVMQLLEDTFGSWDAEVALFIGSPKMNEDVLRSCRARGIPAFGSIWDA